MNYVYLHGFNSAYDPLSEKVLELKKLGKVYGITYDTFGTYQEIYDEILNQLPDSEEIVFVGTSLGGFWAAEMARRLGSPSVIINPCTNPRDMLQKYVDVLQVNYITGDVNMLTRDTIVTYPTAGITSKSSYLPLVLLDMGDEVIDPYETLESLEGFPTVEWAEGSHRFNHMKEALEHIQSYVNHCSYVDI